MNYRVFGAVCVIIACGGWGFLAAAQHMQKISLLRQLCAVMDQMECELRFRNLSLPRLIRQAGEQTAGKLHRFLNLLSEELEAQIRPNAQCCMVAALEKSREMPELVYKILYDLGTSLGKYDLQGQLMGLEAARSECSKALSTLENECKLRTRSYQTLGLCAGAAIVILFI